MREVMQTPMIVTELFLAAIVVGKNDRCFPDPTCTYEGNGGCLQ